MAGILAACSPTPAQPAIPTETPTPTITPGLLPTINLQPPSKITAASPVASQTIAAPPTEAATATVTSTATPDTHKQIVDFLNSPDSLQPIQQYAVAEGFNMNDVQTRLQDPKALQTLKDSQGKPFDVLMDTQNWCTSFC